MRRFRDMAISHKLVVAFSLTTAVALTLATFFFALSTVVHERKSATDQLMVVADLIGANSTAALVFGDVKAAQETLHTLQELPEVVRAILRDASGAEFARYQSPDFQPDNVHAGRSGLDLAYVHVSVDRPIRLDNDVIGRIELLGALRTRLTEVRSELGLAIAASLLSFMIAGFVAFGMQRSITEPLRRLTGSMVKVSREHDYAVRADVTQEDELGILARGMNEMLSRAQERDAELARHRHELENIVEQRTADLRQANEQLKRELEQRERTQLELSRAHEALERHNEEFALLKEMNERLQVCHSVMETRPVIAFYARRLFAHATGGLYLYSSSRSLLEAHVLWGEHAPDEQSFPQDDCWALRQGRLHAVDNPADGLLCPHCPPDIAQPYLCVPMIAYGDVIGVLHLRLPAGNTGGSAALRPLALTTGEQLALAIANLKLREALQVQSVRDPLTGLYNRRFMQETLERELTRALRTGSQVGLVMLDVDHFKRYNDTHGHEAGDTVLEQIGQFLLRAVRGGDVACRYGGEEFMLILPGVDEQIALSRAQQIRRAVKGLHIQHSGQNLESITISLGVALAPMHGRAPDELVNAADMALYKAKEQGRDRVVLAEAPAATDPSVAGSVPT